MEKDPEREDPDLNIRLTQSPARVHLPNFHLRFVLLLEGIPFGVDSYLFT